MGEQSCSLESVAQHHGPVCTNKSNFPVVRTSVSWYSQRPPGRQWCPLCRTSALGNIAAFGIGNSCLSLIMTVCINSPASNRPKWACLQTSSRAFVFLVIIYIWVKSVLDTFPGMRDLSTNSCWCRCLTEAFPKRRGTSYVEILQGASLFCAFKGWLQNVSCSLEPTQNLTAGICNPYVSTLHCLTP